MWQKMDVDRIIGAVALLMIHEVDALSRQWRLLGESWEQMRQARSRRQWRDCRAETQQRLSELRGEDRQLRRELWQGLQRDLGSRP